MNLIDSHCHIHEANYPLNPDEVIKAADAAGVTKIICVGTDMRSSADAVKFVTERQNVWAVIGVHPHESKHGIDGLDELVNSDKVVGIGEIGLDYYYNHSPRDTQIDILNRQIELAIKHDLPISFHVREAFDDFWPILDNFGGKARGVIHSFTDNIANLERSLNRDFLIGVNGIMTFNKDPLQHKMYQAVPIERMILETDAPFLAPKPHRGKTNQPAFIKEIAQSIAQLNDTTLDEIAKATTKNAERLFGI